jgi:lipooligosaccharide transport system ATP-binding protein
VPAPLVLTGLTKRYGDCNVVDGIDLSVAAGQCHGLLGPNGAGKTTTLRLALGLTQADAGDIELLGWRIPEHAAQARARIGVVPQNDSLDPDFTVRENLLAYGRYFGMRRAEVERRIPDLLDFAGLTGKEHALVPTLSGGMKRRLTLARALVNDPELIVLDEPTTGLDPQARHLVWQGLRRLTAQGKTLLLTTHFMEEAERLCDRVSIIDNGRIIAEGSPRELIRSHIEKCVLEVRGEGVDAWFAAHGTRCARHERIGDTVFCYLDDPGAALSTLEDRADLSVLQRPASLEDLFLKLTGRDLRD